MIGNMLKEITKNGHDLWLDERLGKRSNESWLRFWVGGGSAEMLVERFGERLGKRCGDRLVESLGERLGEG